MGKSSFRSIIQLIVLLLPTIAFAITTPTIVSYPHDTDGNYSVSWSAATDINGVASYELQEADKNNETILIDGAENGLGSWEVSGFTATNETAYSGTKSFYSGKGYSYYATMTLKTPIPVTNKENLTFWTKYDTSYYDYFYVKVSEDKTNWTYLNPTIYGYQGSFVKKSYSLSDYVGKSLYICLAYYSYSGYGIYIDDLTIEGAYNFHSLSNLFTSTSYNVSGKTNGNYYYRVRAKSQNGDWSSYSLVSAVEIGPDIYPPLPPTMTLSKTNYILGETFTINWSTPTDESGIAAYEIQEIAGELGSSFIDGGESGSTKWNMTDFSLDYYGYSSDHSFCTSSGSNVNASLELKEPLNIRGSETLKFRLYDYYGAGILYVEGSFDKVTWQQLTSFSGYANWNEKSCGLGLLGGKFAYIRFRYVTSGAYSGVVKIDDIRLAGVPANTPKILSSSIVSNSFNICPPAFGKYNYMVRAKDLVGNWSAFNVPVSVMVAASSGVDLSVSAAGIRLTPERCAEGDDLSILVTVRNNGAQTSNGELKLYNNEKDSFHLIGSKFIHIEPLSSLDYLFNISTFAKGADPRIIAVVSDYSSEADLSNNEASKQAQVIAMVRPTFCYPSPFNPGKESTTMVYRLDKNKNIQIIIFNSDGQIVSRRAINSGNNGAKLGLNEVKWDGRTDFGEVARNGVYIYKIIDGTSKNAISSGKVMVLR